MTKDEDEETAGRDDSSTADGEVGSRGIAGDRGKGVMFLLSVVKGPLLPHAAVFRNFLVSAKPVVNN